MNKKKNPHFLKIFIFFKKPKKIKTNAKSQINFFFNNFKNSPTIKKTQKLAPIVDLEPKLIETLESSFIETLQNSEGFIRIPNTTNFKYQPLEKFDEQVLQDIDPELLLKKGPIRGFSKWHDTSNGTVWKECVVLDYIKQENCFVVQWPNSDTNKKVNIDKFINKLAIK